MQGPSLRQKLRQCAAPERCQAGGRLHDGSGHGRVYTQDNLLHGRFLAELTKEVLTDLEASKYQHAEYRISIYGRKRVEWDILAAWICQNQLYSDNVVWLIQVRAGKPSGALNAGTEGTHEQQCGCAGYIMCLMHGSRQQVMHCLD